MAKKKRTNIKTEKTSLKENYRKSFRYIMESKRFIYFIIASFIFFILLAVLVPTPEVLEQKILEIIANLLEQTEGMSAGRLMSFIFFNNLQSSFLGLFLGIGLGVFSFITTVVNGYLLGFVMLRSAQIGGVSVLWRLLPHGIFELPALFISLGLGLKLGTFILRRDKMKSLKEYLIESARVFVFVILPLLLIAAVIEGSLIFLSR